MSEVDIRSQIHHIVSSITPLDELEQSDIHFVLNWIKSGAEIFRLEKPAIPPTHLVVYFLIVSDEMDQVLLVDHKKAKLWLPSGGHVDLNEDPKEAVRREANEELGIDVDFLFDEPIFLTVTETVGNVVKHIDVSLWYLLKGAPHQMLDYDTDEFNQIRWFSIEEIPFEKADPHMKRCIQKMLSLKQTSQIK